METVLSYVTVPNFLAVLYLIILEGVLSVDNALALAVLVKSRLDDPEDQKRALRWGIWGAYFFRILVIFIGVWLMSHWWVRGLAAGYLVYLGASELLKSGHGDQNAKSSGLQMAWLTPLWSTILVVELTDIMFSIDSIAVALSVSNKVPVLILGAVLGIIAMRFAAQFFIGLLDKFPLLGKAAFVLVLLAGVKILLELAHEFHYVGFQIPETGFIVLMFVIIGSSMFLSLKRKAA